MKLEWVEIGGRVAGTPTAVASKLGVSRRTVYNWIEAGGLKTTVHEASGRTFIYLDDASRTSDGNTLAYTIGA